RYGRILNLHAQDESGARIRGSDIENLDIDGAEDVDGAFGGSRWCGGTAFAPCTVVDAEAELIRELLARVGLRGERRGDFGGGPRASREQQKRDDGPARCVSHVRCSGRRSSYLGGI